TSPQVCASQNKSRSRNPGDKALGSALPCRATTERTGRPDQCAPLPAAARCRMHPAALSGPAHPLPAALAQCPERAWKRASSLTPLSQTNLRDLPLLLHRFLKFGSFVIFQPPLKPLQDLSRGLAGRPYDENWFKSPLVFSFSSR